MHPLLMSFLLQGFQYVCTKSDVDIYQGTRPGSQVLNSTCLQSNQVKRGPLKITFNELII